MGVRIELTQGSPIGTRHGVVKIFENERLAYIVHAHVAHGHGADMGLYPYVQLGMFTTCSENKDVERSRNRPVEIEPIENVPDPSPAEVESWKALMAQITEKPCPELKDPRSEDEILKKLI